MRIQLSDHFTYKKLLWFTMPSIFMMIFTSIYGVVDGFFVSNFVGKTPFAAVNFIFPFLMILGSLGFMVGIGFSGGHFGLKCGQRVDTCQCFGHLRTRTGALRLPAMPSG